MNWRLIGKSLKNADMRKRDHGQGAENPGGGSRRAPGAQRRAGHAQMDRRADQQQHDAHQAEFRRDAGQALTPTRSVGNK